MTHIKKVTNINDNTLAVLDMADAMIELLESADYALYMIQDILLLLEGYKKYAEIHEYFSDYCYQVQNIGINYTLGRFSGISFPSAIAVLNKQLIFSIGKFHSYLTKYIFCYVNKNRPTIKR